MRRTSWFYVALLLIFVVGVGVRAQQPSRAVTAADYARAEKFLAPNVTGLVVGGAVAPTWIGRGGADDRFAYRTTLTDGTTQTLSSIP
jgi:Na+/proline symporter